MGGALSRTIVGFNAFVEARIKSDSFANIVFVDTARNDRLVTQFTEDGVAGAVGLEFILYPGGDIPGRSLWLCPNERCGGNKENRKKDAGHCCIPFRYLVGLQRFRQKMPSTLRRYRWPATIVWLIGILVISCIMVGSVLGFALGFVDPAMLAFRLVEEPSIGAIAMALLMV